jgi:hypothetical protein
MTCDGCPVGCLERTRVLRARRDRPTVVMHLSMSWPRIGASQSCSLSQSIRMLIVSGCLFLRTRETLAWVLCLTSDCWPTNVFTSFDFGVSMCLRLKEVCAILTCPGCGREGNNRDWGWWFPFPDKWKRELWHSPVSHDLTLGHLTKKRDRAVHLLPTTCSEICLVWQSSEPTVSHSEFLFVLGKIYIGVSVWWKTEN